MAVASQYIVLAEARSAVNATTLRASAMLVAAFGSAALVSLTVKGAVASGASIYAPRIVFLPLCILAARVVSIPRWVPAAAGASWAMVAMAFMVAMLFSAEAVMGAVEGGQGMSGAVLGFIIVYYALAAVPEVFFFQQLESLFRSPLSHPTGDAAITFAAPGGGTQYKPLGEASPAVLSVAAPVYAIAAGLSVAAMGAAPLMLDYGGVGSFWRHELVGWGILVHDARNVLVLLAMAVGQVVAVVTGFTLVKEGGVMVLGVCHTAVLPALLTLVGVFGGSDVVDFAVAGAFSLFAAAVACRFAIDEMLNPVAEYVPIASAASPSPARQATNPIANAARIERLGGAVADYWSMGASPSPAPDFGTGART